ncbi:hypothetical protein BDF14DRAFT_1823645 [Spinellus fusiger]|nr:hypothetical protein BDF14DRAFT_1823645 [Spinellus fusiger]
MTLLLTVPEAAASADTIQFKLVLGGENNVAYMATHQLVKSTTFRSFQQISWLHDNFTRTSPLVAIPPLPEPPALSWIDDQDYVERKRLQVARFFEKVIQRKRLADHASFIHFLSSELAPTEIGKPQRGVLSFLRFNKSLPSERSLTSYKVFGPVEEEERDTFHRHQLCIITQGSCYGSIDECQAQLIQAREGLGDTLAHMGDQVIETTQSKYRLGDQDKSRDAQRGLDRGMQVFGLLMDELGFIFTRQGKEETMKFSDVMIEYKHFTDSLKNMFNIRMQRMIDYSECIKQRNKKKDKTKVRLGPMAPEVSSAGIDKQEAIDALEKSQLAFHTCHAKVKKEVSLFESQKRHDIKTAMMDYVRLHVRYEKAKLESLEKALEAMRSITENPTTYTQPLVPNEEEDHSSASSVSYRPYDSDQPFQRTPRRKQRVKKHEPHVLQSSASLPTWSRKQPSHQMPVRVPSLPQHDNPRVHLSASYDERIGKAWPTS